MRTFASLVAASLAGATLLSLTSLAAAQQPTAPPSPTPRAQPAPPAAAAPQPVLPQAQPVQPAQPPPPMQPQPQPAPVMYGPPPAAPPAYGVAAAPTSTGPVAHGLLAAAMVGLAGPFGGDTTASGPYHQGAALGALAGYAFHPNIAVAGFFQHIWTSLAYRDTSTVQPSDNSASINLYGGELRGMIGEGMVQAWAGAGVAFGSGTLTLKTSRTAGGVTTTSTDSAKVSFKAMPVASIGADVFVTPNLALGPMVRWYITGVDSACDDATANSPASNVGGFTYPAISTSSSRCADNISANAVPDILYLGFGLTYYQH